MDLSEVEKLDSPVKTLKLSEAMRIGARLRPQYHGDLFYGGSSCALGAAYEGLTGQTTNSYNDVARAFPILRGDDDGSALNELAKAIYRMNDRGKTREQIADWLEAQGY